MSGSIDTGIGQPVRRKEDFRLLTGRGRFSEVPSPTNPLGVKAGGEGGTARRRLIDPRHFPYDAFGPGGDCRRAGDNG